MGDARIKTRRLAAATATFKWTFRPVTETIADNVWQGLAMQIEVESPGNPIHWLIEDSTWEIGGKASGCTLIQRDTSAMDLEQVVEAGSQLSTIEKFYTDSGKTICPMDMMPRVAGSSIFDFQVKGGTALCLFSEKPGLSRARIDKFADEDVIHYIERPFFC